MAGRRPLGGCVACDARRQPGDEQVAIGSQSIMGSIPRTHTESLPGVASGAPSERWITSEFLSAICYCRSNLFFLK